MQRWKVENPLHVYRGRVEQKYIEVAARRTPVYFRQDLSENLRTPVKTCTVVIYGKFEDSRENLYGCNLWGI